MFENESISTQFSELKNPISIEEENVVRKNIIPDYFEVERMIEYLNNHSLIGKEVFDYSFTRTARNSVVWTFLSIMAPVTRDTFIKRLPIYLYDLAHPEEDSPMSMLFDSFKNYYLSSEDFDEDYFGQRNEYPEGFDLEPLYLIIQKIIYDYKIPLKKVFSYIESQFGSLENYEIFLYWYQYINLVSNLNEGNVFPRNILYSLNVELEKNGKEPIMFYPAVIDDLGHYAAYKTGNRFCVGGYFPTDENDNIVRKWVAVWVENAKNPSLEQLKKTEERNRKIRKRTAALRRTLCIELTPDTMIFLGNEERIQTGYFEEEIVPRNYWEQAYVGPKNMKIDCAAIIAAREARHLSAKDVADATDINPRTYQRIEAGDSSPDGLNIIKLIDFLNLEYTDLIHKDVIEDTGFSKFRSGSPLSCFLPKTAKEESN